MTTPQDRSQDLTPAMLEMQSQLAQLQQELAQLKQLTQALPPIATQASAVKPAKPKDFSTTRRNTLKRLGLVLLSGLGAGVAVAISPQPSEARVIANPASGAGRVGAIIVPPGIATPGGTPAGVAAVKYGLVATDGSDNTFNLTKLAADGTGVSGFGSKYGVYGNGATYGVRGDGPFGVWGLGTSTGSTGVLGGADLYGVWGVSANIGVYGSNFGTANIGVKGDGITGVYGTSTSNGVDTSIGVKGDGGDYGVYGTSPYYGVYGNGVTGVWGYGSGTGVYGSGTTYGVFGSGTSYAGYFSGNVHLDGTLTGGTKSFKIDHPLDPANKYLYHTSVESPDMMNIYNGNVTLDQQGEATVTMPGWFEALNFDFRYQLTCLGEFAPVFVAQKLANGRFKIAGGKSGQEVSWQMTGIRQDAYAKAHRIQVEVDKTGDEKGKYLHPELFGQPEEKSVSPRPPQRPGEIIKK